MGWSRRAGTAAGGSLRAGDAVKGGAEKSPGLELAVLATDDI